MGFSSRRSTGIAVFRALRLHVHNDQMRLMLANQVGAATGTIGLIDFKSPPFQHSSQDLPRIGGLVNQQNALGSRKLGIQPRTSMCVTPLGQQLTPLQWSRPPNYLREGWKDQGCHSVGPTNESRQRGGKNIQLVSKCQVRSRPEQACAVPASRQLRDAGARPRGVSRLSQEHGSAPARGLSHEVAAACSRGRQPAVPSNLPAKATKWRQQALSSPAIATSRLTNVGPSDTVG